MKLSIQLQILLVALVAFLSACTENSGGDGPAPAARKLELKGTVDAGSYAGEHGYTLSKTERRVLFHTRAGASAGEVNYAGNPVEVPQTAYSAEPCIDVYGWPSDTYIGELLVARIHFAASRIDDISDGILYISDDNVTEVEYLADRCYSIAARLSLATADLLADYGYTLLGSDTQWRFFDDSGNSVDASSPSAVTAAYAQPVVDCYGYRTSGDSYTREHVLTLKFEKKATEYYADPSRIITLADGHETEYHAPRNYVLNVSLSLGDHLTGLLAKHGYNLYSSAYKARFIGPDGSVVEERQAVGTISTVQPSVQYYIELDGYPMYSNIVRERVANVTFKPIPSEKLASGERFVLDGTAPHDVEYVARRNYVLRIRTAIATLVGDLLDAKGYNLYSSKYMLRFYDGNGTAVSSIDFASPASTVEAQTELYVELYGYPKDGPIVSGKVAALSFGPFASPDIATAEDAFEITAATPCRVEYFID